MAAVALVSGAALPETEWIEDLAIVAWLLAVIGVGLSVGLVMTAQRLQQALPYVVLNLGGLGLLLLLPLFA